MASMAKLATCMHEVSHVRCVFEDTWNKQRAERPERERRTLSPLLCVLHIQLHGTWYQDRTFHTVLWEDLARVCAHTCKCDDTVTVGEAHKSL